MLHKRIAETNRGPHVASEFALENMEHLLDAAAGRIRFEIPQPVRRASAKAQAAVDAARVILVRGRRTWDGIGWHSGSY